MSAHNDLVYVQHILKAVSPEFRQKHVGVPWSFMAKMRDILIHHYWEVDLNVVWVTLQRDLLGLVPLLKSALD